MTQDPTKSPAVSERISVPRDWLETLRRREVQRLHAAFSTRDWHAAEKAGNELRDKIDSVLHDPKARLAPAPEQVGVRERLVRAADIEPKPMEAHAFRHLARYAADESIAALAQPEAARVGRSKLCVHEVDLSGCPACYAAAEAARERYELALRNIEAGVTQLLRDWEGSRRGDAFSAALSVVQRERAALAARVGDTPQSASGDVQAAVARVAMVERDRNMAAPYGAVTYSEMSEAFRADLRLLLAALATAPSVGDGRLRELRTLSDAATPGPWRFDHDWHRCPMISGEGVDILYVQKIGGLQQQANAGLVIAAVNYVRSLLAALQPAAASEEVRG